ncbi:HEPN domain-containing protein [Thauera aromatica]|uniref:HEPN domain-containing protein n=1 Tax=Thauera aromatica TaxID=59405 RepID=UPI001FFC7989|nr:HEPN domain-containing protein [Thauera aromatica]MCK2089624.1 HEPN domain-containing protein [Thauera aromatica]
MSSPAEFALGLLRRARDDAYVVVQLVPDHAAPDWVIGFHAQQAAEKALKAVLASANVVFPRTHNIAMLLALLRQNGIQPPKQSTLLERLTPFGVAARYDSELDQSFTLDRALTQTEIIAVLEWSEAVLTGVSKPEAESP